MEIDYNYLHNALDRVEHTSTVDAFHYQFQVIQNLIVFLHPEIPDSYFASRFIHGLQVDFQNFLVKFKPTTVTAAYKLASIYEESVYLDYFPESDELLEENIGVDHTLDVHSVEEPIYSEGCTSRKEVLAISSEDALIGKDLPNKKMVNSSVLAPTITSISEGVCDWHHSAAGLAIDKDDAEVAEDKNIGVAGNVKSAIQYTIHVNCMDHTEKSVVDVMPKASSMVSLNVRVNTIQTEQEGNSYFCWEPGPLSSRFKIQNNSPYLFFGDIVRQGQSEFVFEPGGRSADTFLPLSSIINLRDSLHVTVIQSIVPKDWQNLKETRNLCHVVLCSSLPDGFSLVKSSMKGRMSSADIPNGFSSTQNVFWLSNYPSLMCSDGVPVEMAYLGVDLILYTPRYIYLLLCYSSVLLHEIFRDITIVFSAVAYALYLSIGGHMTSYSRGCPDKGKYIGKHESTSFLHNTDGVILSERIQPRTSASQKLTVSSLIVVVLKIRILDNTELFIRKVSVVISVNLRNLPDMNVLASSDVLSKKFLGYNGLELVQRSEILILRREEWLLISSPSNIADFQWPFIWNILLVRGVVDVVFLLRDTERILVSFHIRKGYWFRLKKLKKIDHHKMKEYSSNALNKLKIYSDHFPLLLVSWRSSTGSYLIHRLEIVNNDLRLLTLGTLWSIISSLGTKEQSCAILVYIKEKWSDWVIYIPLKNCCPAFQGLLREKWREYYVMKRTVNIRKQACLYKTWYTSGYLGIRVFLKTFSTWLFLNVATAWHQIHSLILSVQLSAIKLACQFTDRLRTLVHIVGGNLWEPALAIILISAQNKEVSKNMVQLVRWCSCVQVLQLSHYIKLRFIQCFDPGGSTFSYNSAMGILTITFWSSVQYFCTYRRQFVAVVHTTVLGYLRSISSTAASLPHSYYTIYSVSTKITLSGHHILNVALGMSMLGGISYTWCIFLASSWRFKETWQQQTYRIPTKGLTFAIVCDVLDHMQIKIVLRRKTTIIVDFPNLLAICAIGHLVCSSTLSDGLDNSQCVLSVIQSGSVDSMDICGLLGGVGIAFRISIIADFQWIFCCCMLLGTGGTQMIFIWRIAWISHFKAPQKLPWGLLESAFHRQAVRSCMECRHLSRSTWERSGIFKQYTTYLLFQNIFYIIKGFALRPSCLFMIVLLLTSGDFIARHWLIVWRRTRLVRLML